MCQKKPFNRLLLVILLVEKGIDHACNQFLTYNSKVAKVKHSHNMPCVHPWRWAYTLDHDAPFHWQRTRRAMPPQPFNTLTTDTHSPRLMHVMSSKPSTSHPTQRKARLPKHCVRCIRHMSAVDWTLPHYHLQTHHRMVPRCEGGLIEHPSASISYANPWGGSMAQPSCK